jgi:hypothetical protein
MTRSLNFRLALRLSGILLLILLCLALQGMWMKGLVNDKARSTQLANAREHYAAVLSDLDRRLGREAFSLKTRIEAQGVFDSSGLPSEKLLAYLTLQGSSIEFSSLRIENKSGKVITSYDYATHIKPEVSFVPGQVSAWTRDHVDGRLYLVMRQFIWLGKENGYLVLFKPMDHAQLTQITYPGTRLSLWWQGMAVASSDGEDGLRLAEVKSQKPENSKSSVILDWSGPEGAVLPRLLVDALGEDLIGTASIARPVMLGFLGLLLGIFGSFFVLWLKSSRQLDALVRADQHYTAQKAVDEDLLDSLRIAQSGPVDSARTLAESLERRIRAADAEGGRL